MRLLIKQSVLMQQATVVPMASPSSRSRKIKFGSRMLRPARRPPRWFPPAQLAAPDLSQVELDAKLFKAEVRSPTRCRGQHRARRAAPDDDGDDRRRHRARHGGGAGQRRHASADPFLATMDGVKQATSHVVDAGRQPDLEGPAARSREDAAQSTCATRARCGTSPASTRTSTTATRSPSARRRWATSSSRATPVLYRRAGAAHPAVPENLGAGSDQTVILLCNPKNIHVGIWRQIRIESARDISGGHAEDRRHLRST